MSRARCAGAMGRAWSARARARRSARASSMIRHRRSGMGAARAALALRRHSRSERTAVVQQVSEANFEAEVLQSSIPVVVDFFAVWCGPCRLISPILDELSQAYDGKV